MGRVEDDLETSKTLVRLLCLVFMYVCVRMCRVMCACVLLCANLLVCIFKCVRERIRLCEFEYVYVSAGGDKVFYLSGHTCMTVCV